MKWTALQLAAAAGRDEMITLLVSGGFNLHADRELAHRLAVAHGQLTTIKMLLQLGANWRQLGRKFGGKETRNAIMEYAVAVGDTQLTSGAV